MQKCEKRHLTSSNQTTIWVTNLIVGQERACPCLYLIVYLVNLSKKNVNKRNETI